MTLPFFGRGRLAAAPAGDRLGRLRKVLSKSGISHSGQDPEFILARVPAREAPVRVVTGPEQVLQFPFEATERIAVLASGFRLPRSARLYGPAELIELHQFQPQGLVARIEDARRLAVLDNRIQLEHAVVILTSMELPTLSEHDRSMLWRAFGVPVFEYLAAWDGTIVARECQVHDGLHVADEEVIPHFIENELLLTQINRLDSPIVRARTGITAEFVTEHCECGLETPRLRGLAALRTRAVATAA